MDRDPTVFVVDDEEGIRNALLRAFRAAGLKVVAFGSAREFLDTYRAEQGGCLILDLGMPGMSGIELQRELNLRRLAIPVIFLTGTADVAMAVEAMRAGAVDFLEKPFDNLDLVTRTRKAIEMGAEARRHELKRAEVARRLARLTPREREIMDQMLLGKQSKQMAGTLGISPRTVDIHRARVMEKMQAERLADLVRMVLQAGPDHEGKKGREPGQGHGSPPVGRG